MFNTDRTAEADGMGLDLTPFVDASGKVAESIAKVQTANAAMRAAKQKPAPTIINQTGAPARRPNWLAYGLIGLGLLGGVYVVRNLMKRRRR